MSVRKHRKIGGRYHWSNCLLFDYEFLLRWMTAGYSSLTKRMAERAEKMDIIEKHKISSEKLQLLIKFSEDEILKLLEEKENAKEMAGNEEKVIS